METVGPRRWRYALVAIAGVALALRLGLLIATRHSGLVLDPADYNRYGASIALGFGYPPSGLAPGTPGAFRPPVFPYLLGAAYALFGIHPNVGRLLEALLGVGTVLLVAWLGSALWDRRVGLLAGALAALCPSLVILNGSLLSESLFLPLELGIAVGVLALRAGDRRAHTAVLTGGLCGLAALTRSVGILLLLPALLAALSAPATRRARTRSVALVLASCAVVMAPWAIRNAAELHAFVPLNTQGGFTLVGQYNAESGRDDNFQAIPRVPSQIPGLLPSLAPLLRRGAGEAQIDSRFYDDGFSYIGRHPGYVPIAVALDTLRMFDLGKNHRFTTGLGYREMDVPGGLRALTTISIQVLALLALLGVILRATGRLGTRLGSPLVWAIPLLAIAGTVPVAGTVRYRVVLDPFLILLAAVATSARRSSSPGAPARRSAAGSAGFPRRCRGS